MALEIKRDHLFAFIVGFTYSTAPVFVELTMWQATTRSLFIAFLPLLVWSLLRTYGDRSDKPVNTFMVILIFIILGTIHHMFLMLPLFLVAYFSSLFIYNRIRKKSLKERWIYRNQTVIITSIFLLFFLPQFTHQGIYSTVSWKTYEIGLFFSGKEKQVIFINMIIDYWSRTGFFAFMGILGFFSLIYRPRKRIKDVFKRFFNDTATTEIYTILGLIITIPFVTMGVYVSLIFLPFFSIIIAYGVLKLLSLLKLNKAFFKTFLVTFLVVSIGYTVFMNDHWNQNITNRSISEHTYSTSLYIHYHFDDTTVTNHGLMSNRLNAISSVPSLPLGGAHAAWYPPDLLVHEFSDVEDYTFSRLSFDVVVLTQSDYLYTTEYGVNAKDDWFVTMQTSVSDPKIYKMNTRYNLGQAVEYLPQEKQFYFWSIRDSTFLKSLDAQKYVLYDNGEMRIWHL
jgi:hypothetical protein